MYNYHSYLENLFPCVSLRYLLMTQTIVQKGKKGLKFCHWNISAAEFFKWWCLYSQRQWRAVLLEKASFHVFVPTRARCTMKYKMYFVQKVLYSEVWKIHEVEKKIHDFKNVHGVPKVREFKNFHLVPQVRIVQKV